MPLKARSFLPYTLPGVLALLGLWWYTWRKKEQTISDDRKQDTSIGLLLSPDEGDHETAKATHGVTFSEGSVAKESEPAEQERVAFRYSVPTSSSAEEAPENLVVVEPVTLPCHGNTTRDSRGSSPETVRPKLDSGLTTSPNCVETSRHRTSPADAAPSGERAKDSETPLLPEQSWDQTLSKHETDTNEMMVKVEDQTLELVKADRPEPEGDTLNLQFAENLQADLEKDSEKSSTVNEKITVTPKTLDLRSPVSSSSAVSKDSVGVQHHPNGDLRQPADESNIEDLRSLAASLVSEVLSSAAREVTAISCCESLLREASEEARSVSPALNGTEIMQDDYASQVASTFQSVPDQSVQREDQVTEAVNGCLETQGDLLSDHQEKLASSIQSKVQAHGEAEIETQNYGSSFCQSENGFTSEDVLVSRASSSLLASKDETVCFSHDVQRTRLDSSWFLPKVQVQEGVIGMEDSGYNLCQLENGISSEDHLAFPAEEVSSAVSVQQHQLEVASVLSEGQVQEITVTGTEDSGCSVSCVDNLGTGLSSSGRDGKEEQDCFALDAQREQLVSTLVLHKVQTQEETVTGTEDSGCSTCQSEDGISNEDFISTGLSSKPDTKKHLIQTLGIFSSTEKDDGLQTSSGTSELEKPTSSCGSAPLNGVEALRNGSSEAEADQSGGSDVNSMDSMDSCLTLGEDSQESGGPSSELIVWEIEVPRHLVGRLIGKKGRYVSFLKQTSGAKIYISTLPYTQEFQICHIEGSKHQVDKALALIGKKFKDLDLTNVYAPQSVPLTMPSLSITSWLLLPAGVAVEVIVVSIVSAGHVFVQQHTHPTYHALRSLDQQMFLCYSQPGTPALPSPAEVGVICAAPVIDGAWWRAQVISFYKDSDEVEIRYVDYGGYERVKMDTLRQIRSDFVTLPFQGTEVLLDNITPLPGDDQFSTDANSALEEMTRGLSLLAQVTNYDNTTGLPLVQMWSMVGEELVLLNRTLADRGLATWVDGF